MTDGDRMIAYLASVQPFNGRRLHLRAVPPEMKADTRHFVIRRAGKEWSERDVIVCICKSKDAAIEFARSEHALNGEHVYCVSPIATVVQKAPITTEIVEIADA